MAILVSGRNVLLRDRQSSDADRYVYWLGHGEWLEYDAPWERVGRKPLTAERKEELRARYVASCARAKRTPRGRAVIATGTSRPLGWVNRYSKEGVPDPVYVGICICEDAYLNRGFGTEALRLWVGYLFAHSKVATLGLETWSFNPRMVRAAEKAGFEHDQVYPKEMQWQGEWLDLVTFRMERSAWQTAVAGS